MRHEFRKFDDLSPFCTQAFLHVTLSNKQQRNRDAHSLMFASLLNPALGASAVFHSEIATLRTP